MSFSPVTTHLDAALTARRRPRLLAALETLSLPAEISGGDTAVTLANALAPGADRVVTIELPHHRLLHDPASFAVLADWLAEE